ncbi:MAG: hypothetical protein AAFR75_08750 [Pseudomonadota bacterium]
MAEMIQLELNDAALSEKVNKLIDGGLPIEIHVPSDHQHHDALQRSLEYFSTGLDPIGFWSTTRDLWICSKYVGILGSVDKANYTWVLHPTDDGGYHWNLYPHSKSASPDDPK